MCVCVSVCNIQYSEGQKYLFKVALKGEIFSITIKYIQVYVTVFIHKHSNIYSTENVQKRQLTCGCNVTCYGINVLRKFRKKIGNV